MAEIDDGRNGVPHGSENGQPNSAAGDGRALRLPASQRRGLPKIGFTAAAIMLATLLLTLGYANLAGSTDAVLERGYVRALAAADTHWASSRTGDLWLSRFGEHPATLRKAVTIGDRITVGGATRSDVFEVVGLEQIDGEQLGQPLLRIQVVTARVDGTTSGETVRFLFAVEAPATASVTPLPEKVL